MWCQTCMDTKAFHMLWFLMLTWVWLASESTNKLECTCGCGCRCVTMLWWAGNYLHRWMCLWGWPAAVILRVSLQRGGGSGQAQPWEGVEVRELRVRQAGHAIWLIVHVLPVRVQGLRSLGKGSKQVRVQLVHYLLVHTGFKLPGKEGGTHCLLQSGEGGEHNSQAGREEIKRRKKEKIRTWCCASMAGEQIWCVRCVWKWRVGREKKEKEKLE